MQQKHKDVNKLLIKLRPHESRIASLLAPDSGAFRFDFEGEEEKKALPADEEHVPADAAVKKVPRTGRFFDVRLSEEEMLVVRTVLVACGKWLEIDKKYPSTHSMHETEADAAAAGSMNNGSILQADSAPPVVLAEPSHAPMPAMSTAEKFQSYNSIV